jgi:3-hydroxyacyl-[acyl-carrier-protein] dehydratase
MSELDALIELLPQKLPFLFLDTIESHTPGSQAIATKTFPPGHRVFENHLPDEPLVPGVIVVEALAQLCGVALVPSDRGEPIRGYLAEIGRMRFRRLVHPGETIRLTSSLERRMGSAARFDCLAEVGDEVVAEGRITVGGMRGVPGRSE